MRFGDREERERYMDSLEQQMEDRREQIQSTLNRTTESSGRRWTAIEKFRSSLPSFPGHNPARDAEERETSTKPVRRGTPFTREEIVREPSEPRLWWRRMFGGS
jgi:hypothetical protein